jgi:hypothetical protein
MRDQELISATETDILKSALKLKPMKYETTNEGKSVSWMQFSVSVTAPASFQPTSGIDTKNIACP